MIGRFGAGVNKASPYTGPMPARALSPTALNPPRSGLRQRPEFFETTQTGEVLVRATRELRIIGAAAFAPLTCSVSL